MENLVYISRKGSETTDSKGPQPVDITPGSGGVIAFGEPATDVRPRFKGVTREGDAL